MARKFVSPPDLFPDAPYEYAVVSPARATVFTAGACPLDRDGAVVAPGDYEAQTRQTLANLRSTLVAAGSGFEEILKTTIYVVARERADLVRTWNVVADALGEPRPPSTLLGVALLGYPDQLVEIEAVAATAGADA